MTSAAKAYIVAVVAVAGVLLMWVCTHAFERGIDIIFILVMLLLTFLLHSLPVRPSLSNDSQIVFDISEISMLFMITTIGYSGVFPSAISIFVVDILRYRYIMRKEIRWDAVIFNTSQTIICYCFALSCYAYLMGGSDVSISSLREASILIMTGIIYFVAFDVILIPIVSMSTRQPPVTIIREYILKGAVLKFFSISVATLAAFFWFNNPSMLPVLLILVGFNYYTLELKLRSDGLNHQLKTLNEELHRLNGNLNELVEQRTSELQGALARLHAIQEVINREVMHAAHDLRKAIARVDEIARGSPLAQRVRLALGTVEQLVEDMLLAGALKQPDFPLAPQAAPLDAITSAVLDALPDGYAGATLICTCADAQVWADPPRVQRVLRNMLDNAVEHRASHVTLRISDAGPQVLLTIRDNGWGIPPARLREIRQRFQSHGKPDGYGIGLHASALIMQRSGGWLTIESEGLGRGTTVTLGFPRPPQPAPPLAAPLPAARCD